MGLLDMDTYTYEKTFTECFVNGVRMEYHGCASDCELKEAKKFYKPWRYIGSGHISWVNNTMQTWSTKHHFFVKRNENERYVLFEKYLDLIV